MSHEADMDARHASEAGEAPQPGTTYGGMGTGLGQESMRDALAKAEERIEELAHRCYGHEQALHLARVDYDRRRSHWWGRFLLNLLRRTT